MVAGGTAASVPYLSAAAALCAATCPSGDRATHSAASSGGGCPGARPCRRSSPVAVLAHPRLVGLGLAEHAEANSEAARVLLGHEQRQLLRLRLLCRATSLVSGGAAADLCAAAARPSGDRATHNAALYDHDVQDCYHVQDCHRVQDRVQHCFHAVPTQESKLLHDVKAHFLHTSSQHTVLAQHGGSCVEIEV
eukprot:scaffold33022_cov63-Phaeocystis_antarctica.AAC.5